MRTTIVDVSFVHSTLRDPRTGERLAALAFGKRGPVWPMMGGSGEDDDGTGSDDDPEGDGTGGTGDDDPEKKTEGKKTGDKAEGKTFDEAYVKKLRDEAASNRTQHTALKTTLDAINAALNPDAKKGDKADPAKLAEQLTGTTSALREAKIEVAVLRAAARHGADPTALTDSRGFMRKVNALDPADEKFGAKVADAIKKAVADNPRLKAPQASGRSGGEFTGGPGGSGNERPTSIREAYARQNSG